MEKVSLQLCASSNNICSSQMTDKSWSDCIAELRGDHAVLICGFFFPLAVVETTLKFTYVEKYPDEVPLWEIHSQENLEDSDVEEILTLLQQQVCSTKLLLPVGSSSSYHLFFVRRVIVRRDNFHHGRLPTIWSSCCEVVSDSLKWTVKLFSFPSEGFLKRRGSEHLAQGIPL